LLESSSKGEYAKEAVKEIQFMFDCLGIEVELPIVVKTDNIGAIDCGLIKSLT
jgi:hypothetical protein